MGEDIDFRGHRWDLIEGCCSWVVRFDFANQIFLGAPEIVHSNFGVGSKKHGFFRVCGHRPRPLLGQNFNMAKGFFKILLSL